MSIERVEKIEAHIVEFSDKEWPQYTRYSADCWTVRMGESDEPVYSGEDELEAEFQAYMKAHP